MVQAIGVDLLNHFSKISQSSVVFPISESALRLLWEQEKADWYFFYDVRTVLADTYCETLDCYLMSIERTINMVVDKKMQLPFLIKRDALGQVFSRSKVLTDLLSLHKILRKEEETLVYNARWPISTIVRPSAMERFNVSILQNWWKPFDSNYIEDASKRNEFMFKEKACVCLSETLYKEKIAENYDVIVLNNIQDKDWEIFCKECSQKVFFYYYKTNDAIVILSGIDESKKLKRTERGCEQTVWLNKIRECLKKEKYILHSLFTAENGAVMHVYYLIRRLKLTKRKVETKGIVVMIDMPGIGDAVRLVHLFSEIKEKYNQEKLTIVVSSKCCKVYELCKEVDTMFICSLRPDLPKFPYIVSSLLTEYFAVNHYKQIVSLAWDTSAYLSNRKRNFLEVYADIAQVSGRSRTQLQIPQKVKEYVECIFQENELGKEKFLIGLQFTASMPSKSWSENKVIECVSLLQEKMPEAVFINVDWNDMSIEGVLNLGKYFDIVQMIEAIKKFDYFVGVDTSGGHIAAMLETPAITVYGKEKPRTGNDHRPLSPYNISIIPAEDCECPEYSIDCEKETKCIDMVSPYTVLYALYKGISLNYIKEKSISLDLKQELIWNLEDNKESFHINETVFNYTSKRKQGLYFDLREQKGNIIIGSCNVPERLAGNTLGIDLWIEKDTFELSSYGMFHMKIEKEQGSALLFSHRLIEGWNLIQFQLDNAELRGTEISLSLSATKKLVGGVCLDRIYALQI